MTDVKLEALQLAARSVGIEKLPGAENQFRTWIIERVNELLEKDFAALVSLLYRIDVPEEKLRMLLNKNSGQDAAVIITELIIERQLQKIASRKKFRDETSETDEERW